MDSCLNCARALGLRRTRRTEICCRNHIKCSEKVGKDQQSGYSRFVIQLSLCFIPATDDLHNLDYWCSIYKCSIYKLYRIDRQEEKLILWVLGRI